MAGGLSGTGGLSGAPAASRGPAASREPAAAGTGELRDRRRRPPAETGGATGTDGATGGATGTGGATAGGTAGAGGGSVTPPSLTACTEYDHNDVNDAPCDDSHRAISNWEIWSLAFSPDGRLLDHWGRSWPGQKIWNFDGHTLTASGHVITTNGQTYVAFSPDGAMLVAGSNGKLATYKTSNWTLGPTFTGVTGQVRGVAVTADSQRM